MSLSRINSFFNYSVKVGRLFGVPIHLHITLVFFLLPVFSSWRQDLVHGLEFAAAIVLSILLHELGHALTAKHYKLTGLTIMLHGFGGFATSSGYRTWKQALMVTLAGPAVTFALGFLLLGLGKLMESSAVTSEEMFMQMWLVKALANLNLVMGVLNMMPSLPFDGGHALEAILSRNRSVFQAMRDVCHVGLIVTVPITIYGFATKNGFVTIMGLMGFITSLGTLLQTGGIKYGEMVRQRKDRKAEEAFRKREKAKHEAYKDEVISRERQRAEKERLRKMLEVVDGDEPSER